MSRRTPKPDNPQDSPSVDDGTRPVHSQERVLPINRRNYPDKETLESILSSVLRSEDSELDQILRALSDLADIVKTQKVDSLAVTEALKKAAVWAVEKSMIDREVRSLAITDDLTGLFNRRGFLAAAAQQLKLAQRDGLNLLLLYCDLDDLKEINDSFGHREGDLALVRTTDALEETFRDSDLLARLGGDEFAVVAWEASLPDIRAILTRLENNLAKANVAERRYHLSLSVGIARFDPHAPVTLAELVSQADRDMYKHKKQRARVASSGK
jgi:diguanylate cyclase (GGDEF)-like protein